MLTVVIILAALGILMIALEVIMPGGILGASGVVAILASLILVGSSSELDSLGPTGRFGLGTGIVVAAIILLILWLKFFTRTGLVKKHLLTGEIDGTKTFDKYEKLLHLKGIAETDLRPAGKARLDGTRWDVVAESGLIERGVGVKVVLVEGSRVVVRIDS